MPNVHIQEAARNLRQAVNDIDIKINETRAELENKTKEAEARMNVIDKEQAGFRVAMDRADNDLETSVETNKVNALEREKEDLQRFITTLRDENQRLVNDLDNQKTKLSLLASELEATA